MALCASCAEEAEIQEEDRNLFSSEENVGQNESSDSNRFAW